MAVARAAGRRARGGEFGTPGGGTVGGGTGFIVSGCTQADRSKNRNSSAFSCADSVLPAAAIGERRVGIGDVRLVARGRRRRVEVDGGEHRAPALRVGRASTGVLNVMYWIAGTLRRHRIVRVPVDGDPVLRRAHDRGRGVLRLVDLHLAARGGGAARDHPVGQRRALREADG